MGLKSGTNLDGVAMATINESLCGEGNSENDDSHHNKVDMSDYEMYKNLPLLYIYNIGGCLRDSCKALLETPR
jgi:hypothetical protein